jgi:hypothetical protein
LTPIAPCRTVCRRRRLSRRLRSPARGAGAERGGAGRRVAGRRVAGRFDGGPGAGYPAPQQNCYESPCAGAPNPAKQRAGVGGAMRPLMNIFFGFRFGSARRLRMKRRAGRRMGRRTRGASLASRPAMSCPRLPARAAPSFKETPLNSHPRRGRSGGLHRRGRPSFRPAARFWPEGACGSNHLSGGGLQGPAPGTGASRRDRPRRTVGRGMCKRRGSPRQPEKHRG